MKYSSDYRMGQSCVTRTENQNQSLIFLCAFVSIVCRVQSLSPLFALFCAFGGDPGSGPAGSAIVP